MTVLVPRAVRVVGAVVVSAAGGVAVVEAFARHTAASARYASTPQFEVWALIIVAAWAALPCVWFSGVAIIGDLGCPPRAAFRRYGVHAGALLAAVVAIGWISGHGAYDHDARSYYYLGLVRILVTYAAATVAILPAVLVFLLVTERVREPSSDPLEQVQRLILFRRLVTRALTTVGSIVSIGVLATGAQRQAFVAVHTDTTGYPAIFVVVWGVTASAILVLMFLPAHRRLNQAGQRLVDETLPLVAPGRPGWRDRLAERSELGELLKLSRGTRDTVDSAVLIAGPLVSAGIALLLPTSAT